MPLLTRSRHHTIPSEAIQHRHIEAVGHQQPARRARAVATRGCRPQGAHLQGPCGCSLPVRPSTLRPHTATARASPHTQPRCAIQRRGVPQLQGGGPRWRPGRSRARGQTPAQRPPLHQVGCGREGNGLPACGRPPPVGNTTAAATLHPHTTTTLRKHSRGGGGRRGGRRTFGAGLGVAAASSNGFPGGSHSARPTGGARGLGDSHCRRCRPVADPVMKGTNTHVQVGMPDHQARPNRGRAAPKWHTGAHPWSHRGEIYAWMRQVAFAPCRATGSWSATARRSTRTAGTHRGPVFL